MKKLLSFPLHQQQHLMKLNQLLMSFSAMALAFLFSSWRLFQHHFPDFALPTPLAEQKSARKLFH